MLGFDFEIQGNAIFRKRRGRNQAFVSCVCSRFVSARNLLEDQRKMQTVKYMVWELLSRSHPLSYIRCMVEHSVVLDAAMSRADSSDLLRRERGGRHVRAPACLVIELWYPRGSALLQSAALRRADFRETQSRKVLCLPTL